MRSCGSILAKEIQATTSDEEPRAILECKGNTLGMAEQQDRRSMNLWPQRAIISAMALCPDCYMSDK